MVADYIRVGAGRAVALKPELVPSVRGRRGEHGRERAGTRSRHAKNAIAGKPVHLHGAAPRAGVEPARDLLPLDVKHLHRRHRAVRDVKLRAVFKRKPHEPHIVRRRHVHRRALDLHVCVRGSGRRGRRGRLRHRPRNVAPVRRAGRGMEVAEIAQSVNHEVPVELRRGQRAIVETQTVVVAVQIALSAIETPV